MYKTLYLSPMTLSYNIGETASFSRTCSGFKKTRSAAFRIPKPRFSSGRK